MVGPFLRLLGICSFNLSSPVFSVVSCNIFSALMSYVFSDGDQLLLLLPEWMACFFLAVISDLPSLWNRMISQYINFMLNPAKHFAFDVEAGRDRYHTARTCAGTCGMSEVTELARHRKIRRMTYTSRLNGVCNRAADHFSL